MKKIRKLNLSPSQLLTCDEQNAIMAGKTCELVRYGTCRCEWNVADSHIYNFVYVYTPTNDDLEEAKRKKEEAESLSKEDHNRYKNRIDKLLEEASKLETTDLVNYYEETHAAIFDPITHKKTGHKSPTIRYPNSIGLYQ